MKHGCYLWKTWVNAVRGGGLLSAPTPPPPIISLSRFSERMKGKRKREELCYHVIKVRLQLDIFLIYSPSKTLLLVKKGIIYRELTTFIFESDVFMLTIYFFIHKVPTFIPSVTNIQPGHNM